MKLTWHGHGTWTLETGEHTVVIDPFFDENPSATTRADEVNADFILVSHGHFDHIADAASIAKRTGAQVVAIYEISQWLAHQQGLENTLGMNIGGGVELPFGHVKMTRADHSSQLPDGSGSGAAAGFLLTIEGKKVYFACDTGLFGDMQQFSGADVAILPIGDLFTMGPADSVEAVRLLSPTKVLPAHYNTWPPIEQDAAAWAELVKSQTSAEPVVLQPGETIEV